MVFSHVFSIDMLGLPSRLEAVLLPFSILFIMKRFFAVSAALLISLTAVTPALARTMTVERLSRRLVRAEAANRQRVPSDTSVDQLLQERAEAQVDATGLSKLSRARYRTIRGKQMPNTRLGFPTRRTLRERTEGSWLILPPSLVQTGGAEVVLDNSTKPTRRSVVERARWMNGFIPE